MPRKVRNAARASAAGLSAVGAFVALAGVTAFLFGLGVRADPLIPAPSGLSGWDVAVAGFNVFRALHPAAQAGFWLGFTIVGGFVLWVYVRKITGSSEMTAMVHMVVEMNTVTHDMSRQLADYRAESQDRTVMLIRLEQQVADLAARLAAHTREETS